jgi:hypothetical protein
MARAGRSSDGSLLYSAAETVVDNSGEKLYPFSSIAGTGGYATVCWLWEQELGVLERGFGEMYAVVFGMYLVRDATCVPSTAPTVTTAPPAMPTALPFAPYVGITPCE